MAFRFETLLKQRRNREYQVQNEFGAINRKLIIQQKLLESLIKSEHIYKLKFDERLNQGLDVNARNLFDGYFINLKRDQGNKQKLIKQINLQLEIKRKELVSAVIKTKVLVILKKRDFKIAKKQAMNKETFYSEDA